MIKNPMDALDITELLDDPMLDPDFRETLTLAREAGLKILHTRPMTYDERKNYILAKIEGKKETWSKHAVGTDVAPTFALRKTKWWENNAIKYVESELSKYMEIEDSDLLETVCMLNELGITINPLKGTKKDLGLTSLLRAADVLRKNAGLVATMRYIIETAHNQLNNVCSELSLSYVKVLHNALKQYVLYESTPEARSKFYANLGMFDLEIALAGEAAARVVCGDSSTADKASLLSVERVSLEVDVLIDRLNNRFSAWKRIEELSENEINTILLAVFNKYPENNLVTVPYGSEDLNILLLLSYAWLRETPELSILIRGYDSDICTERTDLSSVKYEIDKIEPTSETVVNSRNSTFEELISGPIYLPANSHSSTSIGNLVRVFLKFNAKSSLLVKLVKNAISNKTGDLNIVRIGQLSAEDREQLVEDFSRTAEVPDSALRVVQILTTGGQKTGYRNKEISPRKLLAQIQTIVEYLHSSSFRSRVISLAVSALTRSSVDYLSTPEDKTNKILYELSDGASEMAGKSKVGLDTALQIVSIKSIGFLPHCVINQLLSGQETYLSVSAEAPEMSSNYDFLDCVDAFLANQDKLEEAAKKITSSDKFGRYFNTRVGAIRLGVSSLDCASVIYGALNVASKITQGSKLFDLIKINGALGDKLDCDDYLSDSLSLKGYANNGVSFYEVNLLQVEEQSKSETYYSNAVINLITSFAKAVNATRKGKLTNAIVRDLRLTRDAYSRYNYSTVFSGSRTDNWLCPLAASNILNCLAYFGIKFDNDKLTSGNSAIFDCLEKILKKEGMLETPVSKFSDKLLTGLPAGLAVLRKKNLQLFLTYNTVVELVALKAPAGVFAAANYTQHKAALEILSEGLDETNTILKLYNLHGVNRRSFKLSDLCYSFTRELVKLDGYSNVELAIESRLAWGDDGVRVLIEELRQSDAWRSACIVDMYSMWINLAKYKLIHTTKDRYPYSTDDYRLPSALEQQIYAFSEGGQAVRADGKLMGRTRILPSSEQDWESALKLKEVSRKPGSIVKLDYTEEPPGREGPEYTVESTPEYVTDELNLQSFTFGSDTWMTGTSVQFHVRSLYLAAKDMLEILGWSHHDKLFASSLTDNFNDLNLSINIGGAGRKGAAAHYQEIAQLIAMTKAGTSSFAHEFVHSIDFRMTSVHHLAITKVIETASVELTNSMRKRDAIWVDPKAGKPGNFGVLRSAISSYPLIISDKTMVKLALPPVKWKFPDVLTRENSIAGKCEQGKARLDYSLLDCGVDPLDRKKSELKLISRCVALSEEFICSLSKWLCATMYKKYDYAYVSSSGTVYPQLPVEKFTELMESSTTLDYTYWPLPWELLARTTEAYVSDWLDTRSRKNTYLTDRGKTFSAYGIKSIGSEKKLLMPYPQQEYDIEVDSTRFTKKPNERLKINDSLESVFDCLNLWANLCFSGQLVVSREHRLEDELSARKKNNLIEKVEKNAELKLQKLLEGAKLESILTDGLDVL